LRPGARDRRRADRRRAGAGAVARRPRAQERARLRHRPAAGRVLDINSNYFGLGDAALAGFGGALRISWNLATLVTIDYGRSGEDAGLYINFGHIF
jgi:hypothetical protein